MRRKKLGKKKSKRIFKKNTGVNKLNQVRSQRGGIRL